MPTRVSLQEVEDVIQKAEPEAQRRFLADLPRILNIEPEDWSLLKASESSFAFWDNLYDDRYNEL